MVPAGVFWAEAEKGLLLTQLPAGDAMEQVARCDESWQARRWVGAALTPKSPWSTLPSRDASTNAT